MSDIGEEYRRCLGMGKNKDSIVYNNDTAIYNDQKQVYYFNRTGPGTTNILLSASGKITLSFSFAGEATDFYVKLYKNDYDNDVLTFAQKIVTTGMETEIEIDLEQTSLIDFAFNDGDFLFVGIESFNDSTVISNILGDFSIELYVGTEIEANKFGRNIYYLTAESIIDELFNDDATIEASLKTIGVTSAQSIMNRLNYISIVPKDFLTDFCIANGAIVNFKNDQTVKIEKISTYFSNLLAVENAVEVTDFKDVVIGLETALSFQSVSAGMEQKTYTVMTYLNDWNKILTFNQSSRNSSENLNLVLSKFRVDFSGILDFIAKNSETSTDKSSDLFMFDPAFTVRATTEGSVYDVFTPRDILENWRTFLEFCFYNFGKDTLEISSNDGDGFNLEIDGVSQMDDFVFAESSLRILPLKIEFSCLLTDVDFTENILKITHNGEDLYIFVTEAQTTDKLQEQKIKGVLIYTPIIQ